MATRCDLVKKILEMSRKISQSNEVMNFNKHASILSFGYWQSRREGFGYASKASNNFLAVAMVFSAGVIIHNRNKLKRNTVYAAGPSDFSSFSRRNSFNFIADVVDNAGEAVVFIECHRKIFGNHLLPTSHGSGFIIEGEGLIITNAHVVGNQSTVKVRLQNDQVYDGYVLDVDQGRDLAAISIQGSGLPYLNLGCSKEIRTGEWVIAMGSPLNLKNTVTAGIVSNVNRVGKELGLHDPTRKDMEYIQTDAAINVGNSGGPLINLEGEVIGVNSMMASSGIGFAIPIDYVKEFLVHVNELRTKRLHKGQTAKLLRRRYLGIKMLTLTPDIAQQLASMGSGLDVQHGVYVHAVHENSPSDRGGLRSGDVILYINGKDILSTHDIYEALHEADVKVTVRRNGRNIILHVFPENMV